MKKVQILALHLNYGGIEKTISDLANNLSNDFDVEIVSTYKILDNPAYKLDKKIKVKYLMTSLKPNREALKKSFKSFRFFKFCKELSLSFKILYLRKKLMIKEIKESSADYIISTRVFHNKLLAKYASDGVIKIGWEHNHYHNDKKYFNNVISSVKKLDYFVLVSKGLYEDYKKAMSSYSCKCVYIPNMIQDINNKKISKLNNHNLVTVSRLSKEKGVLDLIDVIALIKDKVEDIHLDLIGDGPLYGEVQSLIKKYNLEKNVTMHGFQGIDYIDEIEAKASLYIMTSYTESFGIVLLESFSHGVPAVAFSSAEGACELINNKELLINNRNKEDMANLVVNLIDDNKMLKKYASDLKNVLDLYKPEIVIKEWKKIIK